MLAKIRTCLLAASACAVSGCAIGPQLPPWFSQALLEEMQTGQEYSDFITARYAGLSGDPSGAASFYRRAYGRETNDPNLLESAAFATLISGDAEEAIALATSANSSVSDRSPTAQLALVIEDITNGRTKSALQRLKTAGIGPINADITSYLIVWLTAVENPDAALTAISQLPPRRLLSGEQAALEGMVLMGAGRDDKAIERLGAARPMPMTSSGVVSALRARLMASRGDIAGARKVIAMEVEDSGASSATDQVVAMLDSGRPVTRPRLSTRQGAALAIYLASAGGVGRTSPELGALRYSLALHLDPELAPARLMFADALDEQDRTEDAIKELRAVPLGSPWSAEARMHEAWLLDKLNRPGEALVAADQALQSTRRRDVLIGAADLNRIAGDNARARKLYDEVLAADMAAGGGADWRVLFARSNARNAAGDWPGAEADLLAALAIEPDRPELQNALGYGWVNRGDKVAEGLDLIRKAVAARPDQGHIVDSLGWAYFRLGQYDNAILQLERAAELSPSNAEILDHLGDAYWRAGRETEAQYEWEAALGADPDQVRQASLRGKLDKGLPPLPAASLASRP